jgi:hypothetical protein
VKGALGEGFERAEQRLRERRAAEAQAAADAKAAEAPASFRETGEQDPSGLSGDGFSVDEVRFCTWAVHAACMHCLTPCSMLPWCL